jgi:hypothetical protein
VLRLLLAVRRLETSLLRAENSQLQSNEIWAAPAPRSGIHSRQRFYVVRLIGDIAKRLPQLIDRRVEAVFEVTRGRSGPKAVAKIFTSYQLAGPIHQRVQNRPRL